MKVSKVMIDTNIFLDVLLEREGLVEASAAVLTLCEEGKLYGLVSASCVTDIFYIVRKALHSTDAAYTAIGKVLDIVHVCDVTNTDVLLAYEQKAHDFEDCLLSVCAKSAGCKCVVTRNVKDYADFDVPAVLPEDMLEKM